MAEENNASIVIRRVKKVQGGGHHGGAWKVAYADFVTAMMAFFMVMWIVGISDKNKRAAISDYFNNPSASPGAAQTPAPGANGPGGPSNALVDMGGGMSRPAMSKETPREGKVEKPGKPVLGQPGDGGQEKGLQLGKDRDPGKGADSAQEKARALAKEADRQRLESLREELKKAITQSQALEPFKDQLLLDITPEGLRIQIVDKQNRPMFDLGGASLKTYTTQILHELASFIQTVPNRISITGHTDVTRYGSNKGYTNWELSTDRANAARRALIEGGMGADKIHRIVGLADTALFDKQHPDNPINRRISIIVMNLDAAEDKNDEVSIPPVSGIPPMNKVPGAEAAKPAAPASAKAETPAEPAAVPAKPAGKPASPAALAQELQSAMIDVRTESAMPDRPGR
ncbi:chemotaxis protein MotB [Solimonas aquatica]|uniref:Chemotaxis protein MotB n=1 Tax=Solimonas aquatica TaxID=489703 RepID=A0A1H9LNE2_9GAMM|nr:flagellar motor protein MotB [Solimonas aquatica]SER12423.1 chemotaxis protein MotB [Solimonas aquatica]